LNQDSQGFFPRNDLVAANCQYMIAMTWGETGVADGGTKYTYNAASYKVIRWHLSLVTLLQDFKGLTIKSLFAKFNATKSISTQKEK